jgi:SnoaL-like protein
VSAHDEVRALLQRFARAADERDFDALAALFHPEAEIAGSRGALGLEEWLETMRAPRAFPQSMHLLGDPLIELDEGGEGAHLDTYAVVHQLSDPATGNADLTLGIRYFDTVAQRDGAWVFTRRVAQTLWMR